MSHIFIRPVKVVSSFLGHGPSSRENTRQWQILLSILALWSSGRSKQKPITFEMQCGSAYGHRFQNFPFIFPRPICAVVLCGVVSVGLSSRLASSDAMSQCWNGIAQEILAVRGGFAECQLQMIDYYCFRER